MHSMGWSLPASAPAGTQQALPTCTTQPGENDFNSRVVFCVELLIFKIDVLLYLPQHLKLDPANYFTALESGLGCTIPGSFMHLPGWHFQLGGDGKISPCEAEMQVPCQSAW